MHTYLHFGVTGKFFLGFGDDRLLRLQRGSLLHQLHCCSIPTIVATRRAGKSSLYFFMRYYAPVQFTRTLCALVSIHSHLILRCRGVTDTQVRWDRQIDVILRRRGPFLRVRTPSPTGGVSSYSRPSFNRFFYTGGPPLSIERIGCRLDRKASFSSTRSKSDLLFSSSSGLHGAEHNKRETKNVLDDSLLRGRRSIIVTDYGTYIQLQSVRVHGRQHYSLHVRE